MQQVLIAPQPVARAPQPVAATPSLIPRPVVSAALCTALIVAATWGVLAAGWVDHAGGAVVVAIAATVEAALLAAAGIPGPWIVLLGPVLALAAIVPTTLGAMPFDGDATAGHIVSRYVDAITAGLASTSDWPFLVGLCSLLWLCGFWLGWMALRQRRGVLAVLPLYAILATAVLNTHQLGNMGLPLGLTVFFSLLVIADANLDSLMSRATGAGVMALPGTRGRFAYSVAVVAGVLTVVALLLPPVSSVDISSRFFPGSGAGAKASTSSTTGTGSAESGVISFSGATVPGGQLVSQPQQVMSYSTDVSTPVYLRVVNDTQFVSGAWYPDRAGDTSGAYSWDGVPYNAGPLPWLQAPATSLSALRLVHASFVLQVGATGDSSYTPVVGEPASVNSNGYAFGELSGGYLDTIDAVELESAIDSGTVVDTTGYISVATAAQLRAAGTNYPVYVQPYTTLSNDATGGAQVIARIAQQWTAGLTDPYDQATAIETHLRDPTAFHYTLDPPSTPGNQWPIVYFLTTSHEGYCQYFASAMGAMLRSLGIPTRLVNGYGPGTAQVGEQGHQGTFETVTTSDAHSWVEAYFPSYGWIPFEPTPASTDGDYQPFPRGTAATTTPPVTTRPPSTTTKPGFGVVPVPAPAASGAAAHPVSPWLVVGCVAGALVLLLLLAIAWLLAPRNLRGVWRRLETVGLASGAPRRPAETQREYVARLPASSAAMRARLQELAAITGRAEFSRAGGDAASRRQGVHLWRRVLRDTPRLMLALRRARFRAA